MIVKRFVLVAAISIGFVASAATAQTVYTGPGTYQQIGPFTYGPSGSTQQQIGPYTYVTPKSGQPTVSYQQIGPYTYGSNGSSYQQIGQYGYGNDGTTTQQIGDFTYIHTPGGSTVTCQQIGMQTYCN
jgi:hypothetical protein